MFEAFKIGVKLSLVNEVSHGLIRMASDFGRAEHAVGSLQSRLARMSTSTKLMFGGALAIGVGASLAMTLKPAIDAAEKWDTAKRKFSLFGMSEGQNNEAFAFAQHMNIAGSTYVENLQKMTEAQGAFREANLSGSEALAGAKLAAPMLARLAVIGKDSGHEMSEADDKNLIRAIEMSGGLKDAKTFNERADAIYKLVGSSGGNVGYEDVRAFYARGGVAAKGLTDEALMKLEPIIGEMKGTSAGTALMTAFNRLNGNIKLPNQIMHELVDSGVWNRKNITWNSQGGAKNIKSDGLLKGADLLASDPVAWEKTVLEPMYAKLGLVTQNQKNNMNLKLFGRTGGAEFSLIQSQAATIERSPDAIRKHLGIVDAAADLQKSYKGLKVEAAQRFEDLLTNIGTAILPNVNAGLTTLNGILARVTDWTRDNPELVKAVAYTGLFISGLFVCVGVLMLLGAAIAFIGAPITLAVVAIGLLGSAVIWLWKLVPWAKVGDAIAGAGKSFLSFFADLWSGIAGLWTKLKSVLPDSWFKTNAPGTTGKGTPDTAPHGTTTGGSGFVRPRAAAPVQVQTQVNLDGKKIATAVSNHMADGISHATGPAGFNFGVGQATAGQGY